MSLVASGYAAAQNTDEFYSVAVTGGNIVSAGVALGTKTNSLGKLSAANTTWTSVSGSQVTQLVGYVDGGTPGTNDYILFNDSQGTNLPVSPNCGNITASWDAVNGIGTLMAARSPQDRRTLGRLIGDFLRDLWRHVKDPDTGLWVPRPAGALYSPTIILGK